jgi:hypothetical protein
MAMLPLDAYFERLRLEPKLFSEAKFRVFAHQNNLTPYFMWQMLLAPTKFDRNFVVSFFGPPGTGHSSAAIDSAYMWSLMHGVEFNHTYIKPNITDLHDMMRRDEKKGEIRLKAYILDEQNSFKEIFGEGSIRVITQFESSIEVARANLNFLGFISPDKLPHPHNFCVESIGEIDKQRNISKHLIHMIENVSKNTIDTKEVGYIITHKPPDHIWLPYLENKMKNLSRVVLGQSGKEKYEKIDEYARIVIKHPKWEEQKNNDLRLRLIKLSFPEIPTLTRGEYRTLLAYANDFWRQQQEILDKGKLVTNNTNDYFIDTEKDELIKKILKLHKKDSNLGSKSIAKKLGIKEWYKIETRISKLKKMNKW